jgi:histidine ammonia-lyase
MGEGTGTAFNAIRAKIPAALEGDRWLHADMVLALELVKNDSVKLAVEHSVGFKLSDPDTA